MIACGSTKQTILFAGVGVVALLVLIFALPSSEPRSASQREADNAAHDVPSSSIVFPVQVSVVQSRNLVKSITVNGLVQARREIELVAKISGEIARLNVSNGSFVKKGETILEFDNREHTLAFERSKSALLSAQIEYRTMSSYPELASSDSSYREDRIRRAREGLLLAEQQLSKGELSPEDFAKLQREYEAELAYHTASRSEIIANKSGLAQAVEAYGRAKLNLEWTILRAPFAGLIADVSVSENMFVPAGKVMLKLLDMSTLFVVVEVLESEIGGVNTPSTAEVFLNAYPSTVFVGKVVSINPLIHPQSKTAKVTVEITGSKRDQNKQKRIDRNDIRIIRSGMFATVKLTTSVLKNRVLVPKEALLIRDQRPLVFVASNGIAKWHYVEVGEENEEFVEIRSGIAIGDSVVVRGHYTLAHDARVRVIENGR